MSHLEERKEYAAETTVGNQALRAAAVSPGRVVAFPLGPGLTGEEVRRKIALKAYQLFEKRGCVDGRDLDDWLEAERLVLAQIGQSAWAG